MSLLAGLLTVLLLLLAAAAAAATASVRAYWRHHNWRRFERVRLSDADLRPGDLLLFVPHAHGFHNSLFTRNIFSHGALVVESPEGQLYTSESLYDCEIVPGQRASGATCNPLYARLKYYPGSVFLQRLVSSTGGRGLGPAQSARLWRLAQRRAPYPSLARCGLQAILGVGGRSTAATGRHCMQHLAWLLDNLGLTDGRPWSDRGFLAICRELGRPDGHSLDASHAYQAPVQLLYDVDAKSTAPD